MAGEIDSQLVGAGGFLGRCWGQSDLFFVCFGFCFWHRVPHSSDWLQIHYVIEDDVEIIIPLPLPFKSYDYRCIVPGWANNTCPLKRLNRELMSGFKFRASIILPPGAGIKDIRPELES